MFITYSRNIPHTPRNVQVTEKATDIPNWASRRVRIFRLNKLEVRELIYFMSLCASVAIGMRNRYETDAQNEFLSQHGSHTEYDVTMTAWCNNYYSLLFDRSSSTTTIMTAMNDDKNWLVKFIENNCQTPN